MAVDEPDVPKSVGRSIENMDATKSINEQKRLESLLLDDSDNKRSVQHIAEQEVHVVSAGKTSRPWILIGLILLCFFVLGAGYYYLNNSVKPQSPAIQPRLYVSPRQPVPVRPKIDIPVVVAAVVEDTSTTVVQKEAPVPLQTVATEVPLFTVTVGPFVNSVELEQAISQLRKLGLKPQQTPGSGPVNMIRLLEGVYPAAEARIHLAMVKKVVNSAFLLPEGDKLAVYAGSFHQESRAQQMQEDLANKMLNVTLVNSEITMSGTMLTALRADQQTAREVAGHISSFGLKTQVQKKK